jgi:phage terminase small subunit
MTPKQRRFAEEYLIDLNAAAYKRAGYRATGHSAEVNASRLLRNAEVQRMIREGQHSRTHRTHLAADRVLNELAAVAFSDITDYCEWGTEGIRLKPRAQIPAGVAASADEVSQSSQDGGWIKLRLTNKNVALDHLSRHLGVCADGQKPGTRER